MTTLVRDHVSWLGLHTPAGLAAYAIAANGRWYCMSDDGLSLIAADRAAAWAWLESLADRRVAA